VSSATSINQRGGSVPFFVADLGGTYLRCALAGGGDGLTAVARYRLQETFGQRGDGFWATLVDDVGTFCYDNQQLADRDAPLFFAFPGPVTNGRISSTAPTLVGREKVPDLGLLLAQRIQRRIILLNDVSAAAWYFADHLQADRFAVVTVSSGIGAKLFDRRNPGGVFDELPYAGEIGHLVVDRTSDAICDCGGRGHLGAISSGRGIERAARRAGVREPEKFAASACSTLFRADASSMTNEEHLVPAALLGDPWALNVIREAVQPLAAALLTLVVGAGLERVALMGGFAQRLGSCYLSALRTAMVEAMDGGPAQFDVDDILAISGVDDEPGLLGAARYGTLQTRILES
jgi:predicted NBD/HSP70 family sugar kinase